MKNETRNTQRERTSNHITERRSTNMENRNNVSKLESDVLTLNVGTMRRWVRDFKPQSTVYIANSFIEGEFYQVKADTAFDAGYLTVDEMPVKKRTNLNVLDGEEYIWNGQLFIPLSQGLRERESSVIRYNEDFETDCLKPSELLEYQRGFQEGMRNKGSGYILGQRYICPLGPFVDDKQDGK